MKGQVHQVQVNLNQVLTKKSQVPQVQVNFIQVQAKKCQVQLK